jgi:ribosome-binding protein aMBF1 (putative translation factor)
LTSLLKAKGISKYKLSKDTKINYRTIQYWGAGKCLPSDKNAELVAAYLGLNIEESKDDPEAKIKSLEARVQRIEKKLGINLKEQA